MSLRSPVYRPRFRPGQAIVVLACLGLTAYFAYHVQYGRHGLLVRDRLVERAALLDFEIRSLEAARDRARRDAELLAKDPPHPDVVEEVARSVLGYAHPRDRILSIR